MKNKILSLTDTIKDRTVQEILNQDKSEYFRLVKKGYNFDDEVLRTYNIKKIIRDVKIFHEFKYKGFTLIIPDSVD